MNSDMLLHLVRLNDAICEWCRATGRSYTMILTPAQADEATHRSLDGKPLSGDTTPERMLEVARMERGEENR